MRRVAAETQAAQGRGMHRERCVGKVDDKGVKRLEVAHVFENAAHLLRIERDGLVVEEELAQVFQVKEVRNDRGPRSLSSGECEAIEKRCAFGEPCEYRIDRGRSCGNDRVDRHAGLGAKT